MKRIRLVAVVLVSCLCAQAQDVEITSRGAIAERFAAAVPAFATAPGQEALGIEMAQVIAYDLEFSGLFNILSQARYPINFNGFTKEAARIDFASWNKMGVEFLVYAYVSAKSERLVAQCRLFDTITGLQVVGKSLTINDGSPRWGRLLAHQFSEDIIRYVDGTTGIGSSQICFSSGRPGKKEIYVADYDGANLRQVTKHGAISILPKMSPSGTKIAYVSYKDRYPFLYVLDLKTGKSSTFSK